jgi:chorismate dehydratase
LIFGSISYINLLPFQIFLKKFIKNTQIKQIILYRKSFPSQINRYFNSRRIDVAFISSIKSRKKKCTKVGIISYKNVYSVFILPKESKDDIESDSSNMLAKILHLNGEVIIGDKALKLYLNGGLLEGKDLSLEWYNRTTLPFVFARLCYNSYGRRVKEIADKFSKRRVKIPQYYLNRVAKEKEILPKDINWYLEHINYKIGWKEEKALKLFFKKAKSI